MNGPDSSLEEFPPDAPDSGRALAVRIVRAGLTGWFFLLPLSSIPPTSDLFGLAGEWLLTAVVATLAVFWFSRTDARRGGATFSPLTMAALFHLIWIALGTLYSPGRWEGFSLAARWSELILLAALVAGAGAASGGRLVFMRAHVLGAAVAAAWLFFRPSNGSAAFSDPVFSAHALTAALPSAAVVLASAETAPRRAFWMGMAAAISFCVLSAGVPVGRTALGIALLFIAAGLASQFVLTRGKGSPEASAGAEPSRRMKSRNGKGLLPAAVLFSLLAASACFSKWDDRQEAFSQSAAPVQAPVNQTCAEWGRCLPLWRAAWESWKFAPLSGGGTGSFYSAFNKFGARGGQDLAGGADFSSGAPRDPQNLFLLAAAENGLVGLIAVGSLFVLTALRLRTPSSGGHRDKNRSENAAIVLSGLGAAAALAFMGQPLRNVALGGAMSLHFGAACAFGVLKAQGPGRVLKSSAGVVGTRLLTGALLLCALGAMTHKTRLLWSDLLLKKAETFAWAGENELAIHALEYAKKKYPRSKRISLCLGQVYLLEGRNGDAEPAFREALGGLWDGPAYAGAAKASENLGRNMEAVDWYAQALKWAPESLPWRTARAETLLSAGDPVEAAAEAGRAIALDPDDPLANWTMALASLRMGREADARRMTRKAASLDPALFSAPFAQGLASLDAGRPGEAFDGFERSILEPKMRGESEMARAFLKAIAKKQEGVGDKPGGR